ncbi:MAG: hypothetical protein ABI227_05095 [Rhodanobacter sp.]
MNLRVAVLTLGYATHGLTRWVIGVFYVLMGGLAIIVSHDMPAADRVFPIALMLGLSTGFWWALFASKALSLAIDARQLRLPGIQHGIIAGLLLLTLLTIALPATVFGLFGGDADLLAALLALAATLGFTYVLLPRVLAITAYFWLVPFRSLWRQLPLPGLHDAHFTSVVWLIVLALLGVSFGCWRRQLQLDSPYNQGFHMPIALQSSYRPRRNIHAGFAAGATPNRPWSILWLSSWLRLQPQPGMRRLGPDHPVNSLRMMFGGLFTPLSAIGWVQMLTGLLIVSASMALGLTLLFTSGRHAYPTDPLHDGAMAFVDWFGAVCGLMITLMAISLLRHRWTRVNAELSLLALLPNLNRGRGLRHHLLLATLLPPLFCQTVLLLLMLATALAMHYSGISMLFITLIQLLGAGTLVVSTLCILGSRSLAVRGVQFLLVMACFLITISPSVPMLIAMNKYLQGGSDHVLLSFGVCWLLLASVLCWLGRRGWHALQLRPHPFLPT